MSVNSRGFADKKGGWRRDIDTMGDNFREFRGDHSGYFFWNRCFIFMGRLVLPPLRIPASEETVAYGDREIGPGVLGGTGPAAVIDV